MVGSILSSVSVASRSRSKFVVTITFTNPLAISAAIARCARIGSFCPFAPHPWGISSS
ncbi:MAG: hypothetical protein OXG91_10315 [bacterium]|nr:hypothetical protein [bacterium]